MPPNTKAFLYYYLSPEKPCIAGELRLRVTSSDDPASFENGSDLLRYNGQPWLRPLYVLPEFYIPLYEKLREEQLVPDDLDRALSTLPLPKETLRCNWSHRLYTLNDTFIVDFGGCRCGPIFHVISELGVEKLPFGGMFFDGRACCNGSPYTGAYTIQPSLDASISTILINL